MIRFLISFTGCLLLSAAVVMPQEVVVTGFPLGQGSNVDPSFFRPYYPQLQEVADTLRKYPMVHAVVTGGADGQRYRRNSDAKNPALALGRAHALRNVLVHEFNVDSTRIMVQSEDVRAKGERYRYATVRIVWEFSDIKANLDNLATRLDTLASRPPVEQHITEVTEIAEDLADNMGLQLSAGISSSPFGAIPVVAGAVTWERFVFLECIVGHTFWNSSFSFQGTELDARRRMAGGQIIVYPFKDKPVGIVGGWIRTEEISQEYYKYGTMSEGPVVGVRVSHYDFLSITGVYSPTRYHDAGENDNRTRKDEFLLTLTFHTLFGGEK